MLTYLPDNYQRTIRKSDMQISHNCKYLYGQIAAQFQTKNRCRFPQSREYIYAYIYVEILVNQHVF